MFQKIKIRKMTISRALDKYLKTVSIHKKGHLQEFYRAEFTIQVQQKKKYSSTRI